MDKISALIKSKYLPIAVLSVIALLLRVYLSRFNSYYNDLYTFQSWSLELIRHGFSSFYDLGISDYPPGYLYFLWLFGKLFYFLAFKFDYVNLELIYKLPAIISDILVGVLIFLILKKISTIKVALITSALYLFNPVTIVNSTLWGQVEGIMMFFLLLSVYFLISKKIFLSAIALGAAQTIKPVALMALPLILIYIYFVLTKKSIPKLLIYSATFLATIVFIFIPFNNTGNIFQFVFNRYTFNLDWYQALSLNAFNIWGVFSLTDNGRIIRVDNSIRTLLISYKEIGYLLFVIAYTIVAFIFIRLKDCKKEVIDSIFIQSLGIIYLSLFMFFTRLHERHIFYGLIFSFINLLLIGKISKLMVIGLCVIHVINMYYSYQIATVGVLIFTYVQLLPVIILNVAFYMTLFLQFVLKGYNFSLIRLISSKKKS